MDTAVERIPGGVASITEPSKLSPVVKGVKVCVALLERVHLGQLENSRFDHDRVGEVLESLQHRHEVAALDLLEGVAKGVSG